MKKQKQQRIDSPNNDDNFIVDELIVDKTTEKDSQILFNVDNTIYFYSYINRRSVYNFVRELDNMTKSLRMLKIQLGDDYNPHINLRLASEGGEFSFGITAMERIVTNPIPIKSYIEGDVASAATLFSITCQKRYIYKNSSMLIHQISGGVDGKFELIKDDFRNMMASMTKLKSIYLKYTKLTAKQINELLTRDIYLNAKECLKYGLVDEII